MEAMMKTVKTTSLLTLLSLTALAGLLWGGEAQGAPILLEVRVKEAGTLPEASVEKVKATPRAVRVEKHLSISTKPYDVIGVEPGAPLRIVTSDNRLITPTVEAGRANFKSGEDRVSIVGLVYREEYERGGKTDPMHGMGGMLHVFEVGSSFVFPGSKERVRVIGIVSAKPEAEARKVFLPLATAQRIFGRVGALTHLFVTVEASEHADAVATEIKAIFGDAVEVIRR